MSDAVTGDRTDPLEDLTADQVARWEDLLAYVTDRERPRPTARDDTAGPALAPARPRRPRRGRVLDATGATAAAACCGPATPGPAATCRASSSSAFDIDKLLKERFRHEPLTLGAAWHHGYFRSYFSHAAITHPANDGLREEFSTAWDIVRKRPAVVFRGGAGEARAERLAELAAVRLDLPMIVGPLPYAAGVGLELAYLTAVAGADPAADLRIRTLVAIEADRALRHAAELLPHAPALLVRLAPRHARLLATAPTATALVDRCRGDAARIVELDPWSDEDDRRARPGDGGGGELAELAAAARRANPELLLSVYLRYDGMPREPRQARPAGRRSGTVSSRPPAPTASPCCTTTPVRSSRTG